MAEVMVGSLRQEVRHELTQNILPFWMSHAVDEEHGGFVGRISADGAVDRSAPKGAVLNSRILWTFAATARQVGNPGYAAMADRAYHFLRACFSDPDDGGVYWTLTADGQPLDTKKQVYAQAFALYGVSEYAALTGSDEARGWALELYRLIEEHAFDPRHGGYYEAFSRAWGPLGDVRLSERDLLAPKSMNTNLHVLEAYTNLYRIWPDAGLARQLGVLIEVFLERIIDPETFHQHCFFREDWRPIPDGVSFGHDIETSWLLDEAATVLGDGERNRRASAMAAAMAGAVLAGGLDHDGGLFYSRSEDGRLDTDKHWWAQAEAVVGFLNAFERSGEGRFREAALQCWHFAHDALINRTHGEWHARLARDGTPYADDDKLGLWKCPYHNTRMCLEVMRRTAASW